MTTSANIVQGTRVRLIKNHGIGKAGEEGVVTGEDDEGKLAIEITHTSNCTPVTKLLLGVPPESVTTETKCNRN
jgi:hypothetical protein